MKILLVTTFLPLKYNCHGPNQLLYSLLKVLGRHATIDMLYYELNNEKLTVKSDFSNVNFLGVISPKKLSLYYWFFSKRISLFEFPVPKNINIGDEVKYTLRGKTITDQEKKQHHDGVIEPIKL